MNVYFENDPVPAEFQEHQLKRLFAKAPHLLQRIIDNKKDGDVRIAGWKKDIFIAAVGIAHGDAAVFHWNGCAIRFFSCDLARLNVWLGSLECIQQALRDFHDSHNLDFPGTSKRRKVASDEEPER